MDDVTQAGSRSMRDMIAGIAIVKGKGFDRASVEAFRTAAIDAVEELEEEVAALRTALEVARRELASGPPAVVEVPTQVAEPVKPPAAWWVDATASTASPAPFGPADDVEGDESMLERITAALVAEPPAARAGDDVDVDVDFDRSSLLPAALLPPPPPASGQLPSAGHSLAAVFADLLPMNDVDTPVVESPFVDADVSAVSAVVPGEDGEVLLPPPDGAAPSPTPTEPASPALPSPERLSAAISLDDLFDAVIAPPPSPASQVPAPSSPSGFRGVAASVEGSWSPPDLSELRRPMWEPWLSVGSS